MAGGHPHLPPRYPRKQVHLPVVTSHSLRKQQYIFEPLGAHTSIDGWVSSAATRSITMELVNQYCGPPSNTSMLLLINHAQFGEPITFCNSEE